MFLVKNKRSCPMPKAKKCNANKHLEHSIIMGQTFRRPLGRIADILRKKPQPSEPQKKSQIREFVRGIGPEQWEFLKHFLRTGKKNPLLQQSTIKRFFYIGIEHAEQKNRRLKKPYAPIMGPAERKEVERQALDFSKIFHPDLTSEARELQVGDLSRYVEPIRN
ncbi:MAG: hypothetical protein NUV67_01245, partial [archaeon]|nr:hypothetical protein [archaeon]